MIPKLFLSSETISLQNDGKGKRDVERLFYKINTPVWREIVLLKVFDVNTTHTGLVSYGTVFQV